MAAITWRNVDGPSLSEASRPLESAARLIDNAFTRVGNVLDRQTQVGMDNWDQIKENNTQDFLNRVYSAQGAEGFKALQDSGELDRMLAANGAQIDRAAARSAMDGRLATLQQRDVAGINFRNTMLDDAQAAEVREIGLLTLTDPAAAQARLAANPNLRAAVQLAQGIDNRQQELKNRVWNEQKQTWEAAEEAQRVITRPLEVKKLNSDLQTAGVARAYKSALTGQVNAETEAKRNAAMGDGPLRAVIDKRYEEMIKNGPYDLGTIDTGEGQKRLLEGLKSIPGLSKTAQEDILNNLQKYYGQGAVVGYDESGKPIRAPLGVSTVLQAVSRSRETNPLPWMSRRGDDTVNILDRMFGVTSSGAINPAAEATGAKDNDLIRKMQATMALRAQREALLGTPEDQVRDSARKR